MDRSAHGSLHVQALAPEAFGPAKAAMLSVLPLLQLDNSFLKVTHKDLTHFGPRWLPARGTN